MGKKISFVSSKNRGITLDMLVVKDFFRVNDEKVEFKDVVANENAKNSLVKKGNISIRKEYCKNNTDIICVDGSIAGKLPKNAPEGKRVLIATPYDYQFKAINEYELVKEGDCIAVCISGGKDSMLMAKLFQELKLHNKFEFDVKFLVMDPGYSPANRKVIEENARKLNIPIHIFESDIFESVFNVEKSPCYLCARMRRGHLYHFAQELGCNKIALGHHYDDVIETILMGMLYGSQIQTMMPKLHSTNFEGMELIRPLYLVREDDIKAWRDYNNLRFIQCACKFTDTCTTCNNEENKSKRVEIKELIKTLKQTNPYVEGNIFKSIENVNLDTVVAYKKDGVKHHFLDTYDLPKNNGEKKDE